jgi:2-polyprenyl-6-methoxyphenol hydroxylase-like FAD-dependent oxidoreductase
MLLARQGQRVLVIDRGRYGTDTLSTHALMRGGVLQLHRWGVLEDLKAAGTPPVRRTAFHYGDEALDIEIKPRDGIDALYAPRRLVIDKLLVDAARNSGAEFEYGIRLVDLIRSANNRVLGVILKDEEGRLFEVEANLVIGADGMRSTLANLVQAEPYRLGQYATGNVFGYWSGIDLEGYHWYFRPGVSAGAIQTDGGLHCVFASMPSRRFRDEVRFDVTTGYHQVLAECDTALGEAVESADIVGNYRGFPGQVGFFRQSWGPGWALVGDAAYFKDPLTAHGMTDAFIDAELLARAAVEGTAEAFAVYQTTRDELSVPLFEVTDAIASFEWDMESIQQLHRALSDEMKREVAALTELDQELKPVSENQTQ